MSTTKNQTTVERASDRELVVTRMFNAPPRIVFDAYTRPEHVKRWWAPKPRNVTMVSVDADVRAGGKYRYVFKAGEHPAMAFSGTYSEVAPHSRLVYTENFEPTADGADEGNAAIITVTFEARGEQTHFVSRSLFPSKDILDTVIATGMEGGMRETMDQLDELVASLR